MPNLKPISYTQYIIFFPLISIILFSSISLTALAQDGLTLNVKAGLDSFAKEGMTIPIQVVVDNQGPALEAELQVIHRTDWQRDHIFTIPVQLPSQSRKQIPVHISIQNYARLVINLVDQQGKIRATRKASFQTLIRQDVLAGVLSSNGSLLNSLAELSTSYGRRIAVAHLEIADLPETLQGWSALDMLILNDIDSTQLSTVQSDLLRHWLHAGGRLIIGGGPNAGQTLAGLSNILSFSEIEHVTLSHPITGLDHLYSLPIEDRGPYAASILRDSTLSSPRAESIATQDSLPLITSLRRGEGEIIYVAFDLSLAPMDNLLTQKSFLKQLFGQINPQHLYPLNRLDRTDQIRASLSLVPGFSLPRPRTIVLFLFFYIVSVGPLNYLILGRLKKREWMWGTMPLLILIFCTIGYIRGYGLSGSQVILRQLTMISGQANNAQVIGIPKTEQVGNQPIRPPFIKTTDSIMLYSASKESNDTDSGDTEVQPQINNSLAEHNTFIGVFSTQRTEYEITIDDAPLVQPLSSYSQDLNISYGKSTMITDLRAEIGSMPMVLAHGQLATPDVGAQLHYDSQNRHIQGSIFNNTGRPIDGVYLVYRNRGLRLGTVPTGETNINDKISQRMSGRNLYEFRDINLSEEESLRWVSRDIAVKTVFGRANSSAIVQASQSQAIYLIGWQDGSPVGATLPNHRNRHMAETFLFIRLSQ